MHDAVLDMQSARTALLAAVDEVQPGDWQRYTPYGPRTLHDVLAHLAAADHAWALAARGLLKGEAEQPALLSPHKAMAVRARSDDRRRRLAPETLVEEMHVRRRLLLSLYELLEPRHLALVLPSFGERHNSVRERIWLGYHDRLHADDIRRTLRMRWHPPKLGLLSQLQPAAAALAPAPTLYVIYSVDPVFWERPSPVPGWSYRALLAHIATGDWVLQAHLRHILERGSVADWPDVAAGNAARLAERRLSTEKKLVEEYLSMRHETLRLMSGLTPRHLELEIELWFEPPGSRRRTVLDYLVAFRSHDEQHREQLRPAMRYAR